MEYFEEKESVKAMTPNEELLGRCEADWHREHYKKGAPLSCLFEDD